MSYEYDPITEGIAREAGDNYERMNGRYRSDNNNTVDRKMRGAKMTAQEGGNGCMTVILSPAGLFLLISAILFVIAYIAAGGG